MTVESSTIRKSYMTDGASVNFPIPFMFYSPNDITVFLNGGTLSSGYSVTGAGTGSGTLTMASAPATGQVLQALLNVPLTQLVDLANGTAFQADVLNQVSDRAIQAILSLQDQVGRTLRAPAGDTLAWPAMPSATSRKGLVPIFDAITGLPTLGIPTTQTLTTGLLAPLLNNGISGIEAAAGVSSLISNVGYYEGDIRRYGADITLSDNSAAINAALLVSAMGGAAAFIPRGVWNITNTINATLSSSMYGVGQLSVILATGCDGITFAAQPAYQASRFFRDFVIQGASTTVSNNDAIVCNLPSGRITGIKFANLTILNFRRAVYVNGATGLWNSCFDDVFCYNVYHGYYINGQATYLSLRGGFVQVGTMTGTGPRYGFFAASSAGGNLQSLHAIGWSAYGFEYNMSLTNTFYTSIENCDLSVYLICGLFVSGWQGIFNIRDTWIQVGGASQNHCAIYVADLGSAQYDKMSIDGCSLFGNSGAGSCAIYMGNNAGPISVINNTIGNSINTASWPTAIGGLSGTLGSTVMGANGAYNNGAVIANNTIHSLFSAIILYSSVQNVTVGPNVIQNGVPLTFSAGTTPPGLRYFVPGMAGTATFAAATSVAVSIPLMPNASYRVVHGGNSAGNTWAVNKTTTGFTLNCTNSSSAPTDWSITY